MIIEVNAGTNLGIIFGVICFIGLLFGGFLIYRYRKRMKNKNLKLFDNLSLNLEILN